MAKNNPNLTTISFTNDERKILVHCLKVAMESAKQTFDSAPDPKSGGFVILHAIAMQSAEELLTKLVG